MSGFTEYVTDCLVFKIVEMDVDTAEIDTTMYIIYDKTTRKYLIRGKRSDTSRFQSCTYSYECKFASDLADFIQYLICQDNTVNEILYNFDELPENSNDITFEYLNEYDLGSMYNIHTHTHTHTQLSQYGTRTYGMFL